MVKFTFLPLSDSRLAPEHRAQFLTIGQFIKWELTDPSGTYSGLMIVGEQATPQGFQSMANMTIDLGEKRNSSSQGSGAFPRSEYRISSEGRYCSCCGSVH
jgi:hypothetical protein